MPSLCDQSGCTKHASYGLDDGRKKRAFCSQHAQVGMVNLSAKNCAHQGCNKQPAFGVDDGSKKAEYCSQHPKPGMVDVKSKTCANRGCTTKPAYGVGDGTKKAEYCSQHAKPGMVNVRDKTCAHQGCATRPSFGVDDGGKNAKYCFQHAKAGMVDVKNKRCAHQGCNKRTSPCLVEGKAMRQYCTQHAKTGMVDVNKNKKPTHFIEHAGAGRMSTISDGRVSSGGRTLLDQDRRDVDVDSGGADSGAKRIFPVCPAAPTGGSSSHSEGGGGQKRARQTGVPSPVVAVKTEDTDRLADEANGLVGERGSPSSQSVQSRRTVGIRLRLKAPTRPQAAGGDVVVKPEVSTKREA